MHNQKRPHFEQSGWILIGEVQKLPEMVNAILYSFAGSVLAASHTDAFALGSATIPRIGNLFNHGHSDCIGGDYLTDARPFCFTSPNANLDEGASK